MKVFAIVLLLATVAYGLLPDYNSAASVALLAKADEYVGELQETEDGPVVIIANPARETENGTMASSIFGIPTCLLPAKVGWPICIAKCITQGHVAGYCSGSRCVCVG